MSSRVLSRRAALGRLAGGSAASAFGPGLVLASRRTARGEAVAAPSGRVRLGVIGCGGMGTRHLEALAVNPRCEVAVVCDAFRPRYENGRKVVGTLSGKAPDGVQDFRRVLDRPDIDAVFVPTPDHWHPLVTILACQADKDVYVEKPASPTVAEGRAMVAAARRYGRVVQLGTQQRSMTIFQEAIALVHAGKLGQVTNATCWVSPNGFSALETPGPVPEGLDWDLWLGPAPAVPYSPQRHYGFMGWHDYCRGGQLTNWGVHLMDVVHWGIKQDRPLRVQAQGGTYRTGARGENEEVVEVLWEYPGCTVTWEQRPQNAYGGRGYGIKFQGTEGQLLVDRNTFEVQPESLGIPKYIGEPERSWAHPPHHDDFFDAIASRRRPAADIEQGHRSTTPVLLAGIALKLRRSLEWDGEAERFRHDEAADRLLSRAYRPPWHLPA